MRGGAVLSRVAMTAILGIFLLLAVVRSAGAFEFAPLFAEFTPTGAGSQQVFQVRNPSDQPVAIEVSVFDREMDADGVNTDTPNESDFLVVPAQFVLAPGQSRAIRVRYIGEPTAPVERAYRMRVAQVPVALSETPEGFGRMDVAIVYRANLYVADPGLTSNLKVSSAEVIETEAGPRLQLSLSNDGLKRAVIDGGLLTITDQSGQTSRIGGDEPIQPLEAFAIFPRMTRSVVLDLPEGITAEPGDRLQLDAEFTYLIR